RPQPATGRCRRRPPQRGALPLAGLDSEGRNRCTDPRGGGLRRRALSLSSPGPTSGGGRSGPVVFKFGGSSVADAACMRGVARLVREAGCTPVVVVSALGGTTDALLRAAEPLLRGESADPEVTNGLHVRHREVLEALCPE